MNAVCGTPRLVRNGVAGHEALREGSTGRRFITHNLARTALGTDRSGNRIVLVAVEPSQASQGTMGATLAQMATIMKLLGCHNALNLDGGGSTGMVVRGDHMFFDGEDPKTRRISVGLAVVKRSHVLRSILAPGQAGSR
jgi:exopolysaccharide biosynthesis protein